MDVIIAIDQTHNAVNQWQRLFAVHCIQLFCQVYRLAFPYEIFWIRHRLVYNCSLIGKGKQRHSLVWHGTWHDTGRGD